MFVIQLFLIWRPIAHLETLAAFACVLKASILVEQLGEQKHQLVYRFTREVFLMN